jgi:hypothetical protein
MIDLSGHWNVKINVYNDFSVASNAIFDRRDFRVVLLWTKSVETRDNYCSNYSLFVGVHAVRSLVLLSFAFCVFLPCLLFPITNLTWEEFEDTKGVVRIHISKKNRQHNGQKEKVQKDKQLSTKHTHKTKGRVTRIPIKTEGEFRCRGRVSSSCFTSGTRRVNLVTNPVISHEWGKDWKVFTYPW